MNPIEDIYSCKSACEIFSKDVSFENSSKASEAPILFPHHLQRAEMFALRRSDENELSEKSFPARFASRVQHRLICRNIYN